MGQTYAEEDTSNTTQPNIHCWVTQISYHSEGFMCSILGTQNLQHKGVISRRQGKIATIVLYSNLFISGGCLVSVHISHDVPASEKVKE